MSIEYRTEPEDGTEAEAQEVMQCPSCGTLMIPCEGESGDLYVFYLPLTATGFCVVCDPTDVSPTIH